MINPLDLTGKLILITGASSGIGKATAVKVSELGSKVILIARNEEKLKETQESLADGCESYVYPKDLTKIDELEVFIDDITSRHGKLDGFVHCAGIADMRPLSMTKYAFLHSMMLINYYSFIELSRVYAKKRNNNGGSIVAVSSVKSRVGDKSNTAYSGSKAALEGSIKVMAKELYTKGIRVNSIIAGFINTDMYQEYISNAGIEAFEKNVLSRQYAGLGKTDDVAIAIAYLLSDSAKFVTGTGLVVDGGYLS